MERSLQNMRSQNSLELWAERVEVCRNSGMTVKQWCEENGIVPNTYYRWQKKVFAAMYPNQEEFYEVAMPRSTKNAIAKLEVNGITASIYSGADEESLLAVLRAMKTC